jgi:hypothetical protein
MRYDVKNLQQLKEAVDECDSQDRIVIFPPDSAPVRFRVYDDRIEAEPCDERGDVGSSDATS